MIRFKKRGVTIKENPEGVDRFIDEHINDLERKFRAGGSTDYVVYDSDPVLPGISLTATCPGGTAYIGRLGVPFQQFAITMAPNRMRKYYINPSGLVTYDEDAVLNYTIMTRRQPATVYIYQVTSNDTFIDSILPTSNPFPVVKHDSSVIGSADHFVELFYLFDTTTNWSGGLAVTYGQLILTTNGSVYQVTTPGTTITVPSSVLTGYIPDPGGGSVVYVYYSKDSYLSAFRYAENNGIEWYFDALGLAEMVHMKLISGSTLGPPAGTTMASLIKKHILTAMKHLIVAFYSGGTYLRGMKITTDGWIWECTTAGSIAASNAAFVAAGPHSLGQTVTSGTAHWIAIYQYFGAAQLFWLNVDNTWAKYRYPDSHDSYCSTFFSLIARYIEYTGDFAFLQGASPQPAYATYQLLLNDLIYFNLDTQLSHNFLSDSFQGQIAPWDGSVFNTQYFEDNCETVKGYRDASYVFGQLGDATRSANAITSQNYVSVSGLRPLYNTTYNLVAWYFGNDVSTWANRTDLQFYPYIQAQFYAEKCDLSQDFSTMFSEDQFYAMRQAAWGLYSNWITDRGKDSFPDCFIGLIAAKKWNDPVIAQSFVDQSERFHLKRGSLIISEYACYLRIKELLVPKKNILSVSGTEIIIKDEVGTVTHVKSGPHLIALAISDETTALTTGTAKITFRMPYAFTITAVRASLDRKSVG